MTVEEWAKQQQNSAEAELLRAAGAPRQPVSEVAAPPAPPVADSAAAQAQVVAVVTDQATAEWFYQRFKWSVIAPIEADRWALDAGDVFGWLKLASGTDDAVRLAVET